MTPSSADVIGMARGNAVTVKLNGSSVGAPYRKGEYFWKDVTVRPGASPATGTISFDVDGTAFTGGTVTLPAQVEQTAAPANLAYDADGNLTLDSLWSYQWDGENRLVAMLRVDGTKRVEMEYDHGGRRIGKKLFTASTGGTLTLQEKYLYDGWNLVAILDGANVLQKSFLWGSDMSGSMQGAGGVGGLIAFTKHAAPSTGTWFAAFDGNGNLGALVSAADGSVQATYEYGPFGEVIRATGANAKANPFRFSTKFQDDETDLVYYGYRFYNAATGRWVSRDPIGDLTFMPEYVQRSKRRALGALIGKPLAGDSVFSKNDSLSSIDLLGLEEVSIDVFSVIWEFHEQAGIKTTHHVVINDLGQIVKRDYTTGVAELFGRPWEGSSIFFESIEGTHPLITVRMSVRSVAYWLPELIDISYQFTITFDFCSRRGHLNGRHDGYPSYQIRVKGLIYDWQQRSFWDLLGQGEIWPVRDFIF